MSSDDEVTVVVSSESVPVTVVAVERGPKGDPGPPGTGDTPDTLAFASATWRFNTSLVPPPASGNFRANSPMTTMWINDFDQGGFDRSFGIAKAEPDDIIMLRFDNGHTSILRATAAPVDNTTYWTIPVQVVSGTPEDDRGKLCVVTVFVAALLAPQKLGGGL